MFPIKFMTIYFKNVSKKPLKFPTNSTTPKFLNATNIVLNFKLIALSFKLLDLNEHFPE